METVFRDFKPQDEIVDATTKNIFTSFQNYGRIWESTHPQYDTMTNNCQDFCIALGKFLDPNISAGNFPFCQAGTNSIEKTGYANSAAGEGQELNIFAELFLRFVVHFWYIILYKEWQSLEPG